MALAVYTRRRLLRCNILLPQLTKRRLLAPSLAFAPSLEPAATNLVTLLACRLSIFAANGRPRTGGQRTMIPEMAGEGMDVDGFR